LDDVITTPNIASLFRQIKLLLGMQPQYTLCVHEYTKSEVEKVPIDHGFKIVKSLLYKRYSRRLFKLQKLLENA